MKTKIKFFILALPLALMIPSGALAYQNGLRDSETGLDCNQQRQMLKVAGADTHPHQLKNIHQILKRCEITEREAMNTTISTSGSKTQN